MGTKSLFLLTAAVLVAYYVYTPLPENTEERWKLMLISAGFRSVGHMVSSEFYFLQVFLGEKGMREKNTIKS